MHVVIAPDSFKESLSAAAVAAAIADGFVAGWPGTTYDLVPVGDGGEGTMDALVAALGGYVEEVTVTGPLGTPVAARLGLVDDATTGIVEMATASGLDLVPASRRDPLVATSRGTGELVRAALDRGVGRIVVGLGGSATVDGGAGMLQALGADLRDEDGDPVGPGGGALGDLAAIDLVGLDPRLAAVDIEVASDVDNPLLGEDGAAAVFGPQKGADEAAVQRLAAGLERLAAVAARDVDADLAVVPGGGAAGGLGAALVGLLGAHTRPGIDLVLEAVDLAGRLARADLVITGEGRMDGQSVRGKTPIGVARVAGAAGVPVVALVGSVGPGVEAVHDHGIAAVVGIVPGPGTLEVALANAAENLAAAAGQVARLLRVGGLVAPSTPAGPSAPAGEH